MADPSGQVKTVEQEVVAFDPGVFDDRLGQSKSVVIGAAGLTAVTIATYSQMGRYLYQDTAALQKVFLVAEEVRKVMPCRRMGWWA